MDLEGILNVTIPPGTAHSQETQLKETERIVVSESLLLALWIIFQVRGSTTSFPLCLQSSKL